MLVFMIENGIQIKLNKKLCMFDLHVTFYVYDITQQN